ncbi:auxin efflux carrier [Basidiobolus meristosporus CBS 931.73]|uniref:Auxin efflux carrier n=1 Tax=Basidiobolus meristosporus CBS 931.73 TaxID=1314790 RepID=A0A1Y1YFY4_9FUNG|nr:auxin efflux carrier [Basidiobolus meristosporus CBS 931.73]|eukprot:ORX96868.1 auxin efflux carrier [Basidiobolus meristosporus CBS 931.73]
MDVLKLVRASSEAIIQIAITCGAGVFLCRHGWLTPSYQKFLSALNLNFLTPCLLFVNVASSISPSILMEYWPIPVYSLVFTIATVIITYITSFIFKFSSEERNFSQAATMFPNTNSLPIPLIQSLAGSSASLLLQWHGNETSQQIEARGISYIVVFAILGNFLRFSYGMSLLKKPKELEELDAQDQNSILTQPDSVVDEVKIYSSTKQLDSVLTVVESDGMQDAGLSVETRQSRIWSRVKKMAISIKKMLNPPLTATFIGLIVGLINPVREAMFGENPILRPLTRAVEATGNASIPLILLCLGSQLNGLFGKGQRIQRSLVYVLVVRLLLMPVVAAGIVMASRHLFSLGDDPLFLLTMMILGSSPTAINLINICQTEGYLEDQTAQLLLYAYVLAAPALTCWVVGFLWLVGLAKV